ncbi:cytochrome P450 protein [Rutstroemia sp. NJR-2017a BBW]|nr:cytochrome P450 protein [Rutstroemia sp. NJR-2017a BBW]
MLSYTSLILLFITAEIIRRFCLSLYVAFTGPLAKVPGPLLWKLSKRIWHYHMVRGTSITVSAKLFEKYGDCVRIGMYFLSPVTIFSFKTNSRLIGPREVMFRSKDAIQQILVECDLKKAEDYKLLQEDPHVSNMFTETDAKRYKQMRRPLSAGFSISFLNGLEPLMQSCVNFMVEILESRCASQDNYAIVDVSTMFGNLAMFFRVLLSALTLLKYFLKSTQSF